MADGHEGSTVGTGAVNQEKPNGQDGDSRSSHRWWRRLPRTAVTVLGAIGGLAGGLTYLGIQVAGPSSGQPPSGFPGFVLMRPGIHVQEAPRTTAPAAASLPYSATVYVLCTKTGDPVTGPPG